MPGEQAGARGRGPGAGALSPAAPAGISNFRQLRVWKASIELVLQIYRAAGAFPPDERFALTSQIRRAAVSVPSNIAEGHTRASTREYLNHISMAQASLAEVETQLEIAFRLQYLSEEQMSFLLQSVSALGKQLYALRNALAKRT